SWSGGRAGDRRGAARLLCAPARRVARLRHPPSPAVHALALVVRRDRRFPRTAPELGAARMDGARVLPRDGYWPPRARRAARKAAPHADTVAGARRVRASRSRLGPTCRNRVGATRRGAAAARRSAASAPVRLTPYHEAVPLTTAFDIVFAAGIVLAASAVVGATAGALPRLALLGAAAFE